MHRQPVSSSNLKSIGYDASQAILEVEFHDSRVYQYFGVPPREYRALMVASSHGTYFNAYIRGKYHCSRVK